MTEDEKRLLREARDLLAGGTSNSLIPENRAGWAKERDRVVRELEVLYR